MSLDALNNNAAIIGRDDINDIEAILAITNTDVDAVISTVQDNAPAIFTWDYEKGARPKLNRLYEKAKNSMWNGETDLPWDTEVDQEQVRAIVYRVPCDPFDDLVRQSADAACVEVRDAEHTLRELTDWHDRIVADLPSWPAEGVRIVTVGARHDGAGVEVGVRDVDLARERLFARYGAAAPLIIVHQEPVVPIPAAEKDH